MERADFLTMCQKVSMYPEKFGVRQNIPHELLVRYDGITYYPRAYELGFDTGKTVHTAILHDLKANSITYCELTRVEKLED